MPDPKVRKLRTWRRKLIAHTDYDITVETFDDFLQQHPVDFEETQALIHEAFAMLERWAPYYCMKGEIQRVLAGADDYRQVLDAIRLKSERPQH